MKLNGHGEKKYVTGDLLDSSSGQDWSSILVERWNHGAGLLNPLRPLETEVAIQLSGNSRVRRQGDGEVQDNHSMAGTVWLCPSGIYERSVKIFAEIEECLHVYIPPKLFSETALVEFDIDPAKSELRYEGGFHDALIEQIGRSLRAEMSDPSPESGLLVESLRLALAAHLLKNYSNLSPTSCRMADPPGGLDAKRMQRIVAFINSNLHRSLSLSELAAEACFSPFHFARLFKRCTGMTPHQFVTRRKIEAARRLLEDQHQSLTEIATKTGFSSQAHFSRSFLKSVGVTPGTYRRERR